MQPQKKLKAAVREKLREKVKADLKDRYCLPCDGGIPACDGAIVS
jgi:hypothetical protein